MSVLFVVEVTKHSFESCLLESDIPIPSIKGDFHFKVVEHTKLYASDRHRWDPEFAVRQEARMYSNENDANNNDNDNDEDDITWYGGRGFQWTFQRGTTQRTFNTEKEILSVLYDKTTGWVQPYRTIERMMTLPVRWQLKSKSVKVTKTPVIQKDYWASFRNTPQIKH